MAKKIINQYHNCVPAVCEDNTEIAILSVISNNCSIIVDWTVYNNENSILSNKICWSLNKKTFSNKTSNISGDFPWTTTIPISDNGVIYLKARVEIDHKIYFSKEQTIILNSC